MLFEILATLNTLKTLCSQDAITARIECENLETVYVESAGTDRLLVHDRCYAVNYIMTSDDNTYQDFDDIGFPRVRAICAKHGVCLLNLALAAEESEWSIGAYAESDGQTRELIQSVADCVDELFAVASRLP